MFHRGDILCRRSCPNATLAIPQHAARFPGAAAMNYRASLPDAAVGRSQIDVGAIKLAQVFLRTRRDSGMNRSCRPCAYETAAAAFRSHHSRWPSLRSIPCPALAGYFLDVMGTRLPITRIRCDCRRTQFALERRARGGSLSLNLPPPSRRGHLSSTLGGKGRRRHPRRSPRRRLGAPDGSAGAWTHRVLHRSGCRNALPRRPFPRSTSAQYKACAEIASFNELHPQA